MPESRESQADFSGGNFLPVAGSTGVFSGREIFLAREMPNLNACHSAEESPRLILRMAVWMAIGGIVLMLLLVVLAALRALFEEGAPSPWEWIWLPYEGHFGILPMAAGSAALSLFAVCLGWPLALGIVAWRLCEQNCFFAPFARFCGAMIRFMSAVPTVVYGFAAVFLLTPAARDLFGGSGFCLLTAGSMLVLLVLPSVCLVLKTAWTPRLDNLCPFGLALGFTKLELLRHFVLPRSGKALVAAALLGFGRALGDTLIPLMLAGNAPVTPESFASGMRSLTAHMAMVTANEVGGAAYNSLFLAGMILLFANAGASLLLRRLGVKNR